jgi:hypothetical protein
MIVAGRSRVNTLAKKISAARKRIEQIRADLGRIDLLCSGTLSERMMKCGKPNCHCQTDPAACHGPYYQWRHMRDNKIAQRYVTAAQAPILRQAIENHRFVLELLHSWEEETERLIDANYPPQP